MPIPATTGAFAIVPCNDLAGAIGFIGLIAPHLVRLIIGSDQRRLMPASMLIGAGLLTLADLIARTIAAPADLPIGIVTALIGGPFFLFLLLRLRGNRPMTRRRL